MPAKNYGKLEFVPYGGSAVQHSKSIRGLWWHSERSVCRARSKDKPPNV